MDSIKVIRKNSNRLRPGLSFQFDYWMLIAVIGLVIFGLLMVYSTTFDFGFLYREQDSAYFIRRQLIAAGLGIVGMIVIMQVDYHHFRVFSIPAMLLTLGLLVAVLILGNTSLGADRGLLGASYQPSELAKVVTVMYIAHWLSSKGDRIKQLTYGLLPFAVITGSVCALIVRQPDLSTATLLALTCLTVFFVAGADLRQFAITGLAGGTVFTFLMLTLPHARQRFDSYTTAIQDPSQAHWHVQQSLIALGSGRWFGVGLGQSTQKFGPLPFAHTDGVFAVIGEELGLVGTMAVIGFFVLLAWRGFVAAQNARDSYGSLLAIGITTWLSLQALINMAVITALIPFTGMPIPFISYGGSSLAISLIGVGILLNISRDQALSGRALKQQTAYTRNQPSRTRTAARPQPTSTMEMRREHPGLRRRNRGRDLPGSGGR